MIVQLRPLPTGHGQLQRDLGYGGVKQLSAKKAEMFRVMLRFPLSDSRHVLTMLGQS